MFKIIQTIKGFKLSDFLKKYSEKKKQKDKLKNHMDWKQTKKLPLP